MGAQLTATHRQREARGEQGQRSGFGEAEGPGRHLAHGRLGCPLARVTRLPQAATWSARCLNTFSLRLSGAPWPTREGYPTCRGAHAPSFQGTAGIQGPCLGQPPVCLTEPPSLSPLWASSGPTCGPHYS